MVQSNEVKPGRRKPGRWTSGSTSTEIFLLAFIIVIVVPRCCLSENTTTLLEGFDRVEPWQVHPSDDVNASVEAEHGALCLNFDFHGTAGFASMRRELPLSFSGNFALSLRVRGASPVNTLQVKLIDADGSNVWWIRLPEFSFTGQWQTIRAERRQIEFAWGPAKDRTLRRTAAVEVTLVAERGGRGRVCFDDLQLEALPPPRTNWPPPEVRSSSALPDAPAGLAVDGGIDTAWRNDPAQGTSQSFDIDFSAPRPFGGLVLHWLPGMHASRYDVQFSDDGRKWRTVRGVTDGNGGEDPLLLTESRTRFLRLTLLAGPASAYGLAEVAIKDLAWGASPNAFFENLAKTSRRGLYPRGFSGEQSYWTVSGVEGGGNQSALISEDGAVQTGKGGFTIEPFLIADGRLLTWADVTLVPALERGYLPLPSVTWKTRDLTLRVETFARGDRANSQAVLCYTLENHSDEVRSVTLALAVRPFQVNPPSQFLNARGGVSPIHTLDWNGRKLKVNDEPRVFPLQAPDELVASSFDAGDVAARLEKGDYARASQLKDEFGYASGAMLFRSKLRPHESRSVSLLAPLSGDPEVPAAARRDPAAWVDNERRTVAARWILRLNEIELTLPGSKRKIFDTLRSSLAYILISRDGPALQPGTGSYARSWIRDGAMMSEALLRTGRADAVREFITWYARHQFNSGKVPCCIDDLGADPVPENDSQGELIFTVAELYRFTKDRRTLEALWPHVVRAFDYMEELRAAERSRANLTPQRRVYYGLMPASISHEGYSAKPVHSYWDDFWALKGYDDAVYLARVMGDPKQASRMAEARDQFRTDLHASILTAVKQHHLDILPGSAELGDFDATSTTIALSPGDEQSRLPRDLLENTFNRYWRDFVARRDGRTESGTYTPYELRAVGAFTRLGWRGRVWDLLEFFLADRRPPAWNGWAEVVRRNPRTPGFIGDMPHAWIASDYIRSVLDMFAYRRGEDSAMVIAAGVPTEWLEGEGVGIRGLHTPWGKLCYDLRREEGRLRLQIEADALPPGGFIVSWPYAGAPGRAQVNRSASWREGELKIDAARAEVTVGIP